MYGFVAEDGSEVLLGVELNPGFVRMVFWLVTADQYPSPVFGRFPKTTRKSGHLSNSWAFCMYFVPSLKVWCTILLSLFVWFRAVLFSHMEEYHHFHISHPDNLGCTNTLYLWPLFSLSWFMFNVLHCSNGLHSSDHVRDYFIWTHVAGWDRYCWTV